jgi:hypothetical protein
LVSRRFVRGFAAAVLAVGTTVPATTLVLHGVARAQNFENEGTVNDADANADFTNTAADGDNNVLFNYQLERSQPDQVNEFSDVDNENFDSDDDDTATLIANLFDDFFA